MHGHAHAPLAALISQFEASQWWTPEEIAGGQAVQLQAVAAHFAAHSRWFADRLRQAGLTPETLSGPEALGRLPIMTRADAQTLFAREPAAPLPEGHGAATMLDSSGSTGTPVQVWRTAVNQIDWMAQTMRFNRWSEPDFTARLAVCRERGVSGERSDWGSPMKIFHRTGPSLVIAGPVDIETQIDALRAFAPDSLMAYPSVLSAILDRLDRRGEALPSLKRVRTLSETVPDHLRARFAAAGIALFDCYSNRECGYIALQCPDGPGYHTMDETLIVEIVNDDGIACAPGESGRVLLTDLRNFATPLFRYDTGDHAVRGELCVCGRGLGTIARIQGRTRNLVRLPDGGQQWVHIDSAAMRAIAPILQFQAIQTGIETVALTLRIDRPLTAREEKRFVKLMQQGLGHPFDIPIRTQSAPLPRGPAGKFEEFLCAIENAE